MRQHLFEQQQRPLWQKMQQQLQALESNSKTVDKASLHDFPSLYRKICYHYSIAKSRYYSPQLISELHDLTLRAHQQIYASKNFISWRMLQFVTVDFPVMLRQQARFFWLSVFLFLFPGITLGLLCYFDGEMIYAVLPENQVYMYEAMYEPGNEVLGRERDAGTDFTMFGYYIKHNIGIGFRTFAGGLLAGIGTVASLLFNGVVIGAVAGHLSQLGFYTTFWSFVAGHSAFELTAICICGAAGLCLASALFAPGRLSRTEALKVAASKAVILVMGAAVMLVAAAFVEAFWSSKSAIDPWIKYSVSALLWLLLIYYLVYAGRRHAN